MNLTITNHSVIHHTFVIERHYAAAPERVFEAFANPATKRLWYAADVEEFDMDFRPGGVERVKSRMGTNTPYPGTILANDGCYLDIVDGSRVIVASAMTLGDRRISASLCTFELSSANGGTDLIFTHQAAFFEGADGPAMREEGWGYLLGCLEAELGRA